MQDNPCLGCTRELWQELAPICMANAVNCGPSDVHPKGRNQAVSRFIQRQGQRCLGPNPLQALSGPLSGHVDSSACEEVGHPTKSDEKEGLKEGGVQERLWGEEPSRAPAQRWACGIGPDAEKVWGTPSPNLASDLTLSPNSDGSCELRLSLCKPHSVPERPFVAKCRGRAQPKDSGGVRLPSWEDPEGGHLLCSCPPDWDLARPAGLTAHMTHILCPTWWPLLASLPGQSLGRGSPSPAGLH